MFRYPLFALACLAALGHSRPSAAQVRSRPATPLAPAAVSDLSFQKAEALTSPFGWRTGQGIEYQMLDAKGKLTSTWRYRVLAVSTDGGGKQTKRVTTSIVRLKSGYYDLRNRLLVQQDLTFRLRRDTIYTDGLTEINYEALKSFRDRRIAYSGTPLAWPAKPKVGAVLPRGGVSVQVSSPMVAIAKVETTLAQRTIKSGPEPVTVPAGTFSCYVVESQRTQATVARADMVIKATSRQLDYYAPTIGIVKTEYFDKGGKLMQSRVLSKL